MIYFNRELQNRVITLFHESLVRKGILCLGSKESLEYLNLKKSFTNIDGKEKIYNRKD